MISSCKRLMFHWEDGVHFDHRLENCKGHTEVVVSLLYYESCGVLRWLRCSIFHPLLTYFFQRKQSKYFNNSIIHAACFMTPSRLVLMLMLLMPPFRVSFHEISVGADGHKPQDYTSPPRNVSHLLGEVFCNQPGILTLLLQSFKLFVKQVTVVTSLEQITALSKITYVQVQFDKYKKTKLNDNSILKTIKGKSYMNIKKCCFLKHKQFFAVQFTFYSLYYSKVSKWHEGANLCTSLGLELRS